MKLLPLTLLHCLCAVAPASAAIGQVYLSDSLQDQATQIQTLSATSARLIFAHRLGLSQFHTLDPSDGAALDSLNTFGSPDGLFESDADRSRRKALLFIEGVRDVQSNLLLSSKRHIGRFYVQDPPGAKQNRKLLKDFVDQNEFLRDQQGSQDGPEDPWAWWKEFVHMGFQEIYNGSSLTVAIRDQQKPAKSIKHFKSLGETLDSLFAWASQSEVELIVLTLPPAASSNIFKRSLPSWGEYALVPRSAQKADTESSQAVPSRPTVELETDSATPAQESSSDSVSPTATATASASPGPGNYTGDTSPPRGILPGCFSTLRLCQQNTHNCSGHGTCDVKYSYKEGEDRTVSCYGCLCKNTVSKNDLGEKTTVWTGPACQKQDLTVPFWLLAGFTVALVSVIAWAVGLLYGMGQEDLPSVIGAGVTGPRAK